MKSNILKYIKDNKLIFIIILLSLLLIGCTMIMLDTNSKRIKIQNEIKNLKLKYDSTFVTYYDSEKILNVKLEVLTIENFKNLKVISDKDEIIKRLDKTIKTFQTNNSKLESALIISNLTTIRYSDSLRNTISHYDSILENNIITIYPTYNKDINMFDNWITGNVKLGYNTSDINLNIRSEYDIVLYKERDNIFSKYKLYANCRILNPYDQTKDFVVISKDMKPKRFNISVSGGYGVYPFGHSTFIGITTGLTLITF